MLQMTPKRMWHDKIVKTYVTNYPNVGDITELYFANYPNVCYITKFIQRMLYYQIPPTYVILPNSLNVCYITKFPQRIILPNYANVCYITKFPQRMLYYQIPWTVKQRQVNCAISWKYDTRL